MSFLNRQPEMNANHQSFPNHIAHKKFLHHIMSKYNRCSYGVYAAKKTCEYYYQEAIKLYPSVQSISGAYEIAWKLYNENSERAEEIYSDFYSEIAERKEDYYSNIAESKRGVDMKEKRIKIQKRKNENVLVQLLQMKFDLLSINTRNARNLKMQIDTAITTVKKLIS